MHEKTSMMSYLPGGPLPPLPPPPPRPPSLSRPLPPLLCSFVVELILNTLLYRNKKQKEKQAKQRFHGITMRSIHVQTNK